MRHFWKQPSNNLDFRFVVLSDRIELSTSSFLGEVNVGLTQGTDLAQVGESFIVRLWWVTCNLLRRDHV
jgi:hypothetical protein